MSNFDAPIIYIYSGFSNLKKTFNKNKTKTVIIIMIFDVKKNKK